MSTTTSPAESADRSALLDVLGSHGWAIASSGPIGQLWTSPDGARVGIPFGLQRVDWEWAGVLERVAEGMNLATEDLESLLRGLWIDEFDFRAGTTLTSAHTISAASGAAMFGNVWQLVRSAATAAQTPQHHIRNWSHVGDRAVADAQFGQTKPGSYILPLLVPLQATTTLSEDGADPHLPDTEVAMREPEERRVTRTMMDALDRIQNMVIKPDRVPSDETIDRLVHRGVTRNMLSSIKNIIEHEDVTGLDVTPRWATKVPVGRSTPSERIEIPAAAVDLLEHTIPRFKKKTDPKVEVLSGPIYRMQHRTGETFGIATVDTRRKGRQANVDVFLASDDVARAHDLFKHHEIVEARGRVESSSSGLVMRKPDNFKALGETQLL